MKSIVTKTGTAPECGERHVCDECVYQRVCIHNPPCSPKGHCDKRHCYINDSNSNRCYFKASAHSEVPLDMVTPSTDAKPLPPLDSLRSLYVEHDCIAALRKKAECWDWLEKWLKEDAAHEVYCGTDGLFVLHNEVASKSIGFGPTLLAAVKYARGREVENGKW